MVITLSSFFYSIVSEPDTGISKKNTEQQKFAVLKSKPNIYLFILESYHSLDVMQEVYGIDVAPLQQFMSINDFVIYPDTYSNSPFTLASICDLFSMEHFDSIERGNMDVNQEVRNLIGGAEWNTLFKTLKLNGYYTESLYLENQSYYLSNRGPYLDKFDLVFSSEFDRLLQPLYLISDGLHDKAAKFFKHSNKTSLTDAVSHSLASRPSDQPYFVTIKTGAEHAPSLGGYTWENTADWMASGNYKKWINRSLDELLPLISDIIKSDPDALIIMIGDHGAHRFREFIPPKASSDEEISELCQKRNISKQQIADDYFKVFFAIRMPDGKRDISHGFNMSHRNLFLHVFGELAQDETLVPSRRPSVSETEGWRMVIEGNALEKWVKQ